MERIAYESNEILGIFMRYPLNVIAKPEANIQSVESMPQLNYNRSYKIVEEKDNHLCIRSRGFWFYIKTPRTGVS